MLVAGRLVYSAKESMSNTLVDSWSAQLPCLYTHSNGETEANSHCRPDLIKSVTPMNIGVVIDFHAVPMSIRFVMKVCCSQQDSIVSLKIGEEHHLSIQIQWLKTP